MTTIGRDQFIRDLSQQRISLDPNSRSPQADTLRQAGMQEADLQRIAGSDHVISGDAEFGQLYDRLVQIEAEAASGRREGNFDRAQAVYDSLRTRSGEPSQQQRPISLDFGSSRQRTTGIFGTQSLLPRPSDVALSRSDYVRTLGQSSAAQLDAAARRNVTGPEAGAQQRIRAQAESSATTIEGLERQRDALPANSQERREIDRQIEAQVRHFEGSIASEMASLGRPTSAPNSSDPGQQVIRSLPTILRQSAEREGLAIPGTSGAITPRTSPPYGAGIKFRF